MFDVVIIGAGPAGLTSAIYAARAGLNAVVLEKVSAGGQISKTHEMENYPGIRSISGVEFAQTLKAHAEDFYAKILPEEVRELKREPWGFSITTDASEYHSKTVIAALGAVPKKLGVPGEEALGGSGVSYCATCDGGFFKGRQVAVIGGGDTALEDALYLSKIAKSVKLIHRRGSFRAQSFLVWRAKQAENIEFIMNSAVKSFRGDFSLSEIVLDTAGKERVLPVDGCFIAAGNIPETKLLKGVCALDDNGYIIAGEDACTNIPGLFAAGDARTKRLRQVVTAAADGACAVASAMEYIEEYDSREGYPPNWCY